LVNDKEKLWSFFILSTLRWLVAHPIGICPLCNSNKKDTNSHFFECSGINSLFYQIEKKLYHLCQSVEIKLPMINDIFVLKLNSNNNPMEQTFKKKKKNAKLIKCIESFNNCDKEALFAGFLPKSLHQIIKLYSKKDYIDTEDKFRLFFLEESFKIYKSVTDLKKTFNDIINDTKTNTKINFDPNNTAANFKETKKIKNTNYNTDHQDQKKKKRKWISMGSQ